MPAKYIKRNFDQDSYYHIYNRGLEKQAIFLDKQDYEIFLYYLSVYILPQKELKKHYPKIPIRLQNKNLAKEIELISYVLMPNHFHFLIKQTSKYAISQLLKQLTNAYTYYFNKKYKRVGSMLEGRFKSVKIISENQLLHLNRYIHLNPFVAGLVTDLSTYKYSSYPEYLGNTDLLCKKDLIFSHFMSVGHYKTFIHDQKEYAIKLQKIKHLIIEKD